MMTEIGARLDALIGAYSPDLQAPICVAVSGGSDSMALMHLTASWAKAAQRRIHILSVDHGLRPAARKETEQVAATAKVLNLGHDILVWKAPRTGQAAARDARHRLLATASRAAGATILLLGHTHDDLCETILIRKRRKTPHNQLAGPAIVAPSPVWPQGRGVTLIRPLLTCRRTQLQAWLRQHEHDWIDDPSNEAVIYERVRVRQFLTRHPRLAATVDTHATRLQAQRQKADQALGAALLEPQTVTVSDEGLIELQQTSPDLMPRVLSVLLRIAGGHDRPPRAEAVLALLTELKIAGERRTLAGAWLQKTASGYLIGRDPGEAEGLDADGLWDGRYVRSTAGSLAANQSILMRAARPDSDQWTPIIADRIAHEARAYQGCTAY